ncbi:DUF3310 domain-containing protein [Staphylococcus equorum]|nr:DUF3310 domain-containing protein [Staphylococcus equorum]
MTVVGKVIDYLEFIDEENNQVYINSNGNKYLITDDNYFDLWSKSIEDKTEHIGFDKENAEKSRKLLSNDVQQKKRFDHLNGTFNYREKKKHEYRGQITRLENEDDKKNSGAITSQSIETIGPNEGVVSHEDTVNHPSHYNYGKIEVIDFIEQVTQHYNPNVAYHIGNAIKYLARSPHKNGKEDVAKAKWYIERAYDEWDVK